MTKGPNGKWLTVRIIPSMQILFPYIKHHVAPSGNHQGASGFEPSILRSHTLINTWLQWESPKRIENWPIHLPLIPGRLSFVAGLCLDLNRPFPGWLTLSIRNLFEFYSTFHHKPRYIQNANTNSFHYYFRFQGSLNDIDRSDLFYPREKKYYNPTQMKYGFTRMRMLPEWTGTFIDEFTFSPLQLFRSLSSLVPSHLSDTLSGPLQIDFICLNTIQLKFFFQIHKVWIEST